MRLRVRIILPWRIRHPKLRKIVSEFVEYQRFQQPSGKYRGCCNPTPGIFEPIHHLQRPGNVRFSPIRLPYLIFLSGVVRFPITLRKVRQHL
ncbi:hypothetical protein D3C80_1532920 [compost metagenome]